MRTTLCLLFGLGIAFGVGCSGDQASEASQELAGGAAMNGARVVPLPPVQALYFEAIEASNGCALGNDAAPTERVAKSKRAREASAHLSEVAADANSEAAELAPLAEIIARRVAVACAEVQQ